MLWKRLIDLRLSGSCRLLNLFFFCLRFHLFVNFYIYDSHPVTVVLWWYYPSDNFYLHFIMYVKLFMQNYVGQLYKWRETALILLDAFSFLINQHPVNIRKNQENERRIFTLHFCSGAVTEKDQNIEVLKSCRARQNNYQ